MADVNSTMATGNMNSPEQTAMKMLLDIPLHFTVELGRSKLTVNEVLSLGSGSVVELSKLAGEPLDIYINDRLIARGEAVMVGEKYGVRITQIQNINERARQVSNEEGA